MNSIAVNSLRVLLALSAFQSGEAIALAAERDWSEDPKRGDDHCLLISKTDQFHQRDGSKVLVNPLVSELDKEELVKGVRKWLYVNRYYCERFFSDSPSDRFIKRANDIYWYDKYEFFHESELVPVDHWKTRYIYSKSSYSYVGSELMRREREVELDRLIGYDAYMIGRRYEKLDQFSDDGYYYDRETRLRWRLMYILSSRPGIDIHSIDEPRIIMVDESGRYLPPGGAPMINSQLYTLHCERMSNGGVSCGYGPKDPAPIPIGTGEGGMRFNGAIRRISPEFTPMKIEVDRVTITRRLSHGEKFWLDDRHEVDVNNFFFYADFDDPIRPVYFAPGVLLRDRPKGYGRMPRKEDFIDKEVCLTDCPSDIEWQLSAIRKRIEAHP